MSHCSEPWDWRSASVAMLPVSAPADARTPFRVFGDVARHEALPPHDVLSEFAARSEFRARRCIVLMGSTIPLCRWPFPRLCGFSTTGRAGRFNSRYVLSSSFAFLQSLAQRCLAGRPQPASTSHGLSLPSAHQGSEVHCCGRCRRPLSFACRVWLPSWRLTPSEPVPALFHAGGAHGIHPSELSPHGRYPPRFRGEAPTYRLSRR
jgi:hypothetical protein